MKRYVTSSLLVLALLAMGFSYLLAHSTTVHAWPGAFYSVPDSYSYIAYASVPTDASQAAHASLGPYSSSWAGCSTAPTAREGNSINALTVGNLASVLGGKSTVAIDRATTSSDAQATITANGIDVLQGLIKADKIQASSTSNMTTSDASSTADEIWFSHLSIAGKPFGEDVPSPNTKVMLAGLGYVVFNEQYSVHKASLTRMIDNMFHVYITQENRQVRNGTQIIIGHTETAITRTAQPHILRSNLYDYSASMHISKALGFPTASMHVSCTGGSNQARSVSQLPFVLGHSGLVVEQTSGRILSTGSNTTGLLHVSNAHMLQGLIAIESMDVSASVERSSHSVHRATTSLMNAHVAGVTLNTAVAPNTRMLLKGIGDVTLNEQSSKLTGSTIEQQVNALDIHVTEKNTQGLPVGVHIIVGHVSVSISNY